jgi:hypothetical protein
MPGKPKGARVCKALFPDRLKLLKRLRKKIPKDIMNKKL